MTKQTSNQETKTGLGLCGILLVIFFAVTMPMAIFLYANLNTEDISWKRLENVPENPVEVINFGEWEELFIRTGDNNIYKCEIRGYDLECEETTKESITEHLDLCEGNKSEFQKPSGNVISHNVFRLCGPDMIIDLNYLVLEDGSIWELSESSHSLTILLNLFLKIFFGVSLVIIIGFVAIRIWKIRAKRKSANGEA
jgi:hypothetical protein